MKGTQDTGRGMVLSSDDYDDPVMVIDDVIHPLARKDLLHP